MVRLQTLDLRIGVRIPASQPTCCQLFAAGSIPYAHSEQPSGTNTYEVKRAQLGHNSGHGSNDGLCPFGSSVLGGANAGHRRGILRKYPTTARRT